MNDFSKVKHLGRTWLFDQVLYLPHSASGVGFSFTGKNLSVVLKGDDFTKLSKRSQKEPVRIAIYVDGVRKIDRIIKEEETTIRILHGIREKSHEIKILKLTEAPMGLIGIKDFITNSSAIIAPLPDKSRKIEFIGDSITCGYGVDDENELHHYKTATEDPTRAFAYRTAEILDADYSLVSFSGHGIISGYVENNIPKLNELIPPFYEKIAFSRGTIKGHQIFDYSWDFSKFVPDTIVLNIGTNDDSYCQEYKERQENFATKYAEFLEVVRTHNPNAKLVVILGVMGDRLYPYVAKAVKLYKDKTGDTNISAHKITPIERWEGYVADYHPTSRTHERVADTLAKLLK